jgi:hypothetical protein
MTLLNNIELNDIHGGGFGIGFFALIAGLVSFVVGIVDGYVRPLKCN